MSTTDSLHATALQASITVNDLQKSLAWYTELVGWTVARRIERDGELRGIAINAGDVNVILNQDDFARGKDRTKGVGMSFNVITTQSVDDIAARITSKGGSVAEGPADRPWGARIIRVVDPDGFRWTISQRKA